MVVFRVKSYAEECVPITDEKGEVHQKYLEKLETEYHHILLKENYIITCMKKVYLRKKYLKIINAFWM